MTSAQEAAADSADGADGAGAVYLYTPPSPDIAVTQAAAVADQHLPAGQGVAVGRQGAAEALLQAKHMQLV